MGSAARSTRAQFPFTALRLRPRLQTGIFLQASGRWDRSRVSFEPRPCSLRHSFSYFFRFPAWVSLVDIPPPKTVLRCFMLCPTSFGLGNVTAAVLTLHTVLSIPVPVASSCLFALVGLPFILVFFLLPRSLFRRGRHRVAPRARWAITLLGRQCRRCCIIRWRLRGWSPRGPVVILRRRSKSGVLPWVEIYQSKADNIYI